MSAGQPLPLRRQAQIGARAAQVAVGLFSQHHARLLIHRAGCLQMLTPIEGCVQQALGEGQSLGAQKVIADRLKPAASLAVLNGREKAGFSVALARQGRTLVL